MMLRRWGFRLAFPALGLLIVLMFIGIKEPVPENSANPEPVTAFEAEVPAPVPDSGPDIVFKWQDTSGSWHYADKPPANGAWNALAVDPARSQASTFSTPPENDWQSPYDPPYTLNYNTNRPMRNAATP